MLLGAGLVVLLSVVLVVVGAVTPRLPIDDGLADLQGETRRVGEAALDDGWLMCHEPGDRLLSRQLRVVQVDPLPGCCPTLRHRARSGYRVLIQRYSVFGIPAGTISVCGDMGSCRAGVAAADLQMWMSQCRAGLR